jgi:hypothetical protein
MEVVEVSPPYDVGDITSVLGVRIINDVLGTLVAAGKLGKRPWRREPERQGSPASESEPGSTAKAQEA